MFIYRFFNFCRKKNLIINFFILVLRIYNLKKKYVKRFVMYVVFIYNFVLIYEIKKIVVFRKF